LAGTQAVVLHRDIYWLGKQWAVTGYGVQAVDKKLEMRFDVEADRIFEEGLAEPMRSEGWFDEHDFTLALGVARRRARENPTTFRPVMTDEK
jgi:hypothetical protein